MPSILQQTPPATRNLILANCVVLLIQNLLPERLESLFGLHFLLASDFHVWQFVSYMFLHGGLTHLFFNMFALWMFGVVIEQTLGTKKFLIYYFVCGIGAGCCQELWQLGQYFYEGLGNYTVVTDGITRISMESYLNSWTTVGASGACYGILLAFGMLYPEQRIMLLIPPIPMKAKYFVFAYAVIEVISAFSSNSNIAHFAHLGGMLFGWLLLRYWKRNHYFGYQAAGSYGNGWQNVSSRKPSLWQQLKNKFRKPKIHPSGGRSFHAETDYEYNLRKKQEEERLDLILDKIKKSGYDSLTGEEKDFLFRNSRT